MAGRVALLLALALLGTARALAQDSADAFKDVPRNHWAYAEVELLSGRGILIGYPAGYFRGQRLLTRYEFAVAIDRALDRALGNRIPRQATSPMSPGGSDDRLHRGLTVSDIASLRKLTTEFRVELGSLGNNLLTIAQKLEEKSKEVGNAGPAVDLLPRLTGGGFPPIGSMNGPVRLGMNARLGGEAYGEALNLSGGRRTGTSTALTNSTGSRFAEADSINASVEANGPVGPFAQISGVSGFALGSQILRSWTTAFLPRNDESYPSGPFTDSGHVRVQGGGAETKVGSVALQAYGGRSEIVQGAGNGLPAATAASTRSGFAGPLRQPGQVTVNQLAGLSLGLGVRQFGGGHVRLSAMELAGIDGAAGNAAHALGADINLRLTGRVSLFGDWGKTIPHAGLVEAATGQFTSAFNAGVAYDAGSLNLTAGYRHVDPYYFAPSYWGRIGAWLNPTNIAGPTVRAAWDISPRFAINVGGEMFSAARDRGVRGGLGENDTITRALVGIRWNLSRSLETTLDWEGVYWELQSGVSPSLSGRVHPTEQYITLGTGYSLANNAKLRFLYQVGAYDGKGLLSAPSFGSRSTFNLFTGQVAVKF